MKNLLKLVLLLPFFGFTQEKFIKKNIKEAISIQLPESFIAMSNNERIKKYVSNREPLAIYTSQDRFADLGINQNSMQWTEDDTDLVYLFYKASINSFFDDITFIQDTVKNINGRTFIVFEFESILRDDNVFKSNSGQRNYTYIQYTSYQDQVLLFNFGCPGNQKDRWQSTARQIMESIKVQ